MPDGEGMGAKKKVPPWSALLRGVVGSVALIITRRQAIIKKKGGGRSGEHD